MPELQQWKYHYAGMKVFSRIEIPEWRQFSMSEDDDTPDVRIILTPEGDANGADSETTLGVTDNECWFFAPEAGRYSIRNGEEICVSPLPHAGQRELRLFLLGTAWAALCYQRNLLTVHAGAVAVGEAAVLFCGSPGMGKSTITACLAARGHCLLSDDLCSLYFPPSGSPALFPATRQLRLWDDALAALRWGNQGLERDHFRHDKYLMSWEGEAPLSPLPIRAIYLLGWGELQLQRLSGMVGLSAFVSAATYRGELLERMGMTASYWRACLDLVRQTPVWLFSRPKNLEAMCAGADLLERHWRNSPSTLAISAAGDILGVWRGGI
jgi:hypothetical protein